MYVESDVKLLELPKRRLMSAFIGRSRKNINGNFAASSMAVNELDCLMEVDMVLQSKLKKSINQKYAKKATTPQYSSTNFHRERFDPA